MCHYLFIKGKNMWNITPEDDKNYLVCWLSREGKYSRPHLAYWVEFESHFFSLENNNSHPLHVDIWHEVPKIPKIEK